MSIKSQTNLTINTARLQSILNKAR